MQRIQQADDDESQQDHGGDHAAAAVRDLAPRRAQVLVPAACTRQNGDHRATSRKTSASVHRMTGLNGMFIAA